MSLLSKIISPLIAALILTKSQFVTGGKQIETNNI